MRSWLVCAHEVILHDSQSLTVPAWAEPGGEGPCRSGGGPGGGAHPGIVPLSGDRGHVAEVTLELQGPLTACHIQPPKVTITTHKHAGNDEKLFLPPVHPTQDTHLTHIS